uniref:Uncharacterized protein n=1 Tax=Aquila chrysaetos chrysaetos TaxID=223781 RepID=A0A663DPK1_AQUCH
MHTRGCTHTDMDAHACAHTQTHTRSDACTWICRDAHTQMHAHMDTRADAYRHGCTHAETHKRVHTRTFARRYVGTHAWLHTHTHALDATLTLPPGVQHSDSHGGWRGKDGAGVTWQCLPLSLPREASRESRQDGPVRFYIYLSNTFSIFLL